MPRDQVMSDLFHRLFCLICLVTGRELDWGGSVIVVVSIVSVFQCWGIGGGGVCDFDVVFVHVSGCNLGSVDVGRVRGNELTCTVSRGGLAILPWPLSLGRVVFTLCF